MPYTFAVQALTQDLKLTCLVVKHCFRNTKYIRYLETNFERSNE